MVTGQVPYLHDKHIGNTDKSSLREKGDEMDGCSSGGKDVDDDQK